MSDVNWDEVEATTASLEVRAWNDNDEGPTCFCGNPTVVKTKNLRQPSLLCLFHTPEAGAMFPLPPEKPEWWPEPADRQILADFMERARFAEEPEDDDDETYGA